MGTKLNAFIKYLRYMDETVRADIKNKKPWAYYNNKRSESTFEATRKANKRITNCFGGVAFGLKAAGVNATGWYGSKGKIVYLSDAAKKAFNKAFVVTYINGKKTVKQAIKDGTLKAGDIITYMAMSHTNVYLSNGESFDAGHAYCTGSGEGAKYSKWIGKTPYQNYKIYAIVRIKEDPIYRVRLGIFSNNDNVVKLSASVHDKLGLTTFTEVMSDGTHLYCGSYASKSHANERKKLLKNNGFAAEIEIV